MVKLQILGQIFSGFMFELSGVVIPRFHIHFAWKDHEGTQG